MKLYEVIAKAWKVFYVEAASENDALAHSVVEDEQNPNHSGRFDWEHDETSTREVDIDEEKRIRQNRAKMIVLDSEHED